MPSCRDRQRWPPRRQRRPRTPLNSPSPVPIAPTLPPTRWAWLQRPAGPAPCAAWPQDRTHFPSLEAAGGLGGAPLPAPEPATPTEAAAPPNHGGRRARLGALEHSGSIPMLARMLPRAAAVSFSIRSPSSDCCRAVPFADRKLPHAGGGSVVVAAGEPPASLSRAGRCSSGRRKNAENTFAHVR